MRKHYRSCCRATHNTHNTCSRPAAQLWRCAPPGLVGRPHTSPMGMPCVMMEMTWTMIVSTVVEDMP